MNLVDAYGPADFATDLWASNGVVIQYAVSSLAIIFGIVGTFIGVRHGVQLVMGMLADRGALSGIGIPGRLTREQYDSMSDYDKGGYSFEEMRDRS